MVSLPAPHGLHLKCRVRCREFARAMGGPTHGVRLPALMSPEGLLALLVGASCPVQSCGLLQGTRDAGQARW